MEILHPAIQAARFVGGTLERNLFWASIQPIPLYRYLFAHKYKWLFVEITKNKQNFQK